MRMQNYVADHARSNAGAYGSYKPAVQVGMQPPTAYHMGEGMPAYTHLVQPATAPCKNESALLNGRLLPPTLLTSMKPVNLQNAEKESCAEEGLLDDDKSGAEDKGPSQDYTYCGVDLKPVLPVALAVSTVLGGLCMLLVQIPMLSRFTGLSQVLAKSKRRETQKLVLLVAWTSRRGCRGVHTSRGNIPVLSAAMIIIVNGCKMLLVFSITVNL